MNGVISVTLFCVSFWLYFASFLLFVVFLALSSRKVGLLAVTLLFLGFVLHTIGLASQWIEAGHPPMTNMYEYANLMSWMSAAIFAGIVAFYRQLALGAIIPPAIVIIMVVASVLPQDPNDQLVPAIHSSWFALHVSVAAIAEIAFAFAFSAGIAYLLLAHRASHGHLKGTLSHRPSLQALDQAGLSAIEIGYPLFTLGALFAGSIWALENKGTFWAWDSKEVSALAIWLFYSGYLHMRIVKGWRDSKAAWLSIVGFCIVLLSFLGNLLLGGRLTYG